ncbi:MAG TPA: glycosyltransferase family 4 protein [Methylobacter sp.]|jgi:glycosyltransferase involved in cell wall biosynthesis
MSSVIKIEECGYQQSGATLAILGFDPSAPPAAFLPHGTDHSSYLLCKSIEGSGEFDSIDYFEDDTPPGLDNTIYQEYFSPRPVYTLFKSINHYEAIYLPKSILRWSVYGLRSQRDLTPIICEVGTTHHPNLWRNLLYAGLSGTIRSTDGFIFKSERTRLIFKSIWMDCAERFNQWPEFPYNTVIPNAVDADSNRRDIILRNQIRTELFINDNDLLFLAFSRLAPVSKLDFSTLIRIWKKIVNTHKNAFLVISGALISSPDYTQYPDILREIARDAGVAQNVIVLPNPYERWRDAKNALMSAADVFIHTTRGVEETSPNVILEAMCHELPIIASNWSGIDSMVIPSENGWLIDTWATSLGDSTRGEFLSRSHQSLSMDIEASVGIDATQIENAVNECMDDSKRRSAGENSFQKASSIFQPDRIALQRIRFIKEVSSSAKLTETALYATPPPIIDLNHVAIGLSKYQIQDDTKLIFHEESDDMPSLPSILRNPLGRLFLQELKKRKQTTFDSICISLYEDYDYQESRDIIGKIVITAYSHGLLLIK